jgi:hypothetical protein
MASEVSPISSGPRSVQPLKDEISSAGFDRLAEALREAMQDKGPPCAICGRPVNLRSSETNEHGEALHPACAVGSTERRAS